MAEDTLSSSFSSSFLDNLAGWVFFKIKSWISRSNLCKLNKIWICHISGISQTEWTSVSRGGCFNTLEWKYSNSLAKLQSSEFEMNSIDYIEV